jgi:hypothetical protein
VLLALVTGGCDTSRKPCEGNCPDLSGVYSIRDTVSVGECGFTPYLLAPSLDFQQADEGRELAFQIIDPTTQLAVPLSGDVYAPREGEEGLVGSFQIDSRTTRLAQREGDKMVTLNVTAAGSVTRVEERRVLSLTLITTDVSNDRGCSSTLIVTGEKGE